MKNTAPKSWKYHVNRFVQLILLSVLACFGGRIAAFAIIRLAQNTAKRKEQQSDIWVRATE